MSVVVLYGTRGCHLCDEAEKMLSFLKRPDLELQYRDIADEPLLMEEYALRIPVLVNLTTMKEIHWPFSLLDAARLAKD